MLRLRLLVFLLLILIRIRLNGITRCHSAYYRFLNIILLDKVRDDIAENKKLNYHLYMALKKSLYKPGAFFKGFLFPLCQVCPRTFWINP